MRCGLYRLGALMGSSRQGSTLNEKMIMKRFSQDECLSHKKGDDKGTRGSLSSILYELNHAAISESGSLFFWEMTPRRTELDM